MGYIPIGEFRNPDSLDEQLRSYNLMNYPEKNSSSRWKKKYIKIHDKKYIKCDDIFEEANALHLTMGEGGEVGGGGGGGGGVTN